MVSYGITGKQKGRKAVEVTGNDEKYSGEQQACTVTYDNISVSYCQTLKHSTKLTEVTALFSRYMTSSEGKLFSDGNCANRWFVSRA